MPLIQSIQQFAGSIPAEVKEKKGVYTLTFTLAERKAFLSKQQLTYQAKFSVDDTAKLVKFTELLKESSSGMESSGMSFKTESFKTGKGGQLESVIDQQADLFGKKYDYTFDFKTIRNKIRELAEAESYSFQYQITEKGL